MIPTLMTEKVQQALELATRGHEGKFRNNSKLTYITHPIAVREIALDLYRNNQFTFFTGKYDWQQEQIEIVSLLHDAEDFEFEWKSDVRLLFGDVIFESILALTHEKGETYLDKVLKAKNNPISRVVKIADLRHNQSDLKEGQLKEKYRLAEWILLNT